MSKNVKLLTRNGESGVRFQLAANPAEVVLNLVHGPVQMSARETERNTLDATPNYVVRNITSASSDFNYFSSLIILS